jgi:hypothetical protein
VRAIIMARISILPRTRQLTSQVNWQLLLFLVLVMNVKLVVKVAAILLFVIVNRRMLFEKRIYRQRFILFYVSMIAITVVNVLLNIKSLSLNYAIVVFTGICFWLLCIAAAFIITWFVQQTDTIKLHTTICLFFILNTLVTAFQLGFIIWDSGAANPFMFQGMHQKYFIGTGDRMTGLSLDICTTNALLNVFGIVYFLGRNRMHFVLMCMVTLLLTASNFSNILLVLVLLYLLIFQSTRNQKSVIIVCLVLLFIFLTRVSPQNNQYLFETYQKLVYNKVAVPVTQPKPIPVTEQPDSLLNADQQKQKIALLYLDSVYKAKMALQQQEYFASHPAVTNARPLPPLTKPTLPKADIHSEPYQRKKDTTAVQKELLDYAKRTLTVFDSNLQATKARHLPGKLIALEQTGLFLKKHPAKILTGAGIGNFSSKLAFRSTGLAIAGGYPKKFVYTNPHFLNNHLSLYLDYFSKDAEMHSFINSPNSVYDQLLGEYGVLGFCSFIFLYLGFFFRRCSGYAFPLLLVLLGVLWADYWYEQLSIVILFELMMLINNKEKNTGNE